MRSSSPPINCSPRLAGPIMRSVKVTPVLYCCIFLIFHFLLQDQFDFAPQCALLSAGIWQDLSVTSEFLGMCVRHNSDLRDIRVYTNCFLWGDRNHDNALQIYKLLSA